MLGVFQKKMKKISMIFVFLISFFSLAFVANASSKITLKIASVESASRGDTVDVIVSIDNSGSLDYAALTTEFYYDNTALTLESYTMYDITSSDVIKMPYTVQSDGFASFTYGMPEGSTNYDGELLKLTFTISDTASGKVAIEVKTFEVINDEYEYLDVDYSDGYIYVEVPVDENSIALEESDFTLNLADSEIADLQVNYLPLDTTDSKEFTYVSNDTSVATVDENGVITPVGIGSTTITVTAFKKDLTATVEVVNPITGISLSSNSLELSKGSSETLTVTYNPTNYTGDGTITWTSSDTSVATVDSNGKVTAVGGGSATITATTENNKSATVTVEVNVPITGATISPSDLNLSVNKGETGKIDVTVEPNDTSEKVTYESNDTSIATVDNDGNVSGVGKGTTTITVTVGSYTTYVVNVNVVVPITSIDVDENDVTLYIGQNTTVSASVSPSDYSSTGTVSWTSSDTSVATVDSNGKITGVAKGTTTVKATITDTLTNTVYTDSVTVNVLIPIDTVNISTSSVKLNKGEDTTLSVYVYPSDADEDATVTWTSSDSSVATVDSDGKVTAVGAGSATITGTLKNGMTVECSVMVVVEISSIEIDNTSTSIYKGKTTTLSATVNPSDYTSSNKVTWTSSDSSIATVDENGVVTGLSKGTTTITASIIDSETGTVYTDSVSITVLIPIESITLSDSSLTIIKGRTDNLVATITPDEVDEDTTITWSSSDTSVATVDSNGVVTAVSKGSATITATLANGMSAKSTVNVVVAVESLSLEDSSITLNKNDSKTIDVIINPSDYSTSAKVVWSSSDDTVATVDSDGKITALSAGDATITASITDTISGETYKDTISVTVVVPIESITITGTNLSNNTLNIHKTESDKVTATVNPSDTTEDTTITWTSSDSSIATIDSDGNINALSAGTVTITAKAGSVESSITVNVIVDVEDLKFEKTELTIDKGTSDTLNLVFDPVDATETDNIVWASSNEEVATVTSGVIKAIGVGTTTITASINGHVATINVTVEEVELESISISNDLSNLEVGDTVQLNIVLNPTNATEEVTFSYSSSNESVVTIDENGNLKAVGVGKSTITITTSNGIKVSYEVVVNGESSPNTNVESSSIYGILSLCFLGGIVAIVRKVRD